MAISVFVDPGGIVGRPSVVRTLKNLGAHIISDPKEADAIVINPASDSGRQFLRDWNHDHAKIILDSSWAATSLQAGRLLVATDNWGHCFAVDDGNPLPSDLEDDDEDNRNPLPTPRATPLEPSSQVAFGTGLTSPTIQHGTEFPPHFTPGIASSSRLYGQPQLALSSHISASQQLVTTLQNLPPQVLLQAYLQKSTPANGVLNDPFTLALQDSIQAHTGQLHQLGTSPSPFGTPISYDASQWVSTTPSSSNSFQSLPGTPSSSLNKSITANKKSIKSEQVASSHSRTQSPPSQHGSRLFRGSTGKALTFFVQVELKNRHGIIQQIKKNGGQICSSITDADHAILDQRSSSFKDLLRARTSVGRPAVKPKFIEDCVKERSLLDFTTSTYQFAGLDKTKRAGKNRANVELASPSRRATSERILNTQERVRSSSSATSPIGRSMSNQRGAAASPTPPPEESRVPLNAGRYSFTDEEYQYAFQYLTYLLERDPSLPSSYLAERLTAKMPHHSLKSWKQSLFNSRGQDVEQIRKKAGINFRKRQITDREEPMKSHHLETSKTPSSENFKVIQPTNDDSQITEDPFEQDVMTFSRYLAFESDAARQPGDTDEDVVARLTAPCKSGMSWIEFYNIHTEVIHMRYSELVSS